MKKFLKENWFKISVLIILLVGIIIVVYYLSLSQKETEEITSTTATLSVQDNAEVKVEKCKTTAGTQAQQSLNAEWPSIAANDLTQAGAEAKVVCAVGDFDCMNSIQQSHNKVLNSLKESDYQKFYQQDYLTCLNKLN